MMRGTVTNTTLPTVRPTLEVVRNQFETWRKRRPCRGRIPGALWQAAVGLCREHSICEVSQTLRLNYRGLKNRVTKARDRNRSVKQGPDLGFVRLDLEAPMSPSECLVEMEAPNGTRMRMSFKGAPRDFDPAELGRVFWRQGE
jgi:hypothetical protein